MALNKLGGLNFMEVRMRYLFMLLLLSSCAQKQLWSTWTSNGAILNLQNGGFNKEIIVQTELPISNFWIAALILGGRDWTGLTEGDYFACELIVVVKGDNSSGTITVNHDNIDTPAHNACLEWDNDCSDGVCNINYDHVYFINNNILTIDFFGSKDEGYYPNSEFL